MNDEILFAREDEMEALNLDDAVDSQKYLIFMAGHLKLGVVAEDVVEILNNQVITYLWTAWTRCWTSPRTTSIPCPPTAPSCWCPACALCPTAPAP